MLGIRPVINTEFGDRTLFFFAHGVTNVASTVSYDGVRGREYLVMITGKIWGRNVQEE